MRRAKKTPKMKETDRLTKDEKSVVTKIWMELDDARKVSLGPHCDLQENKKILFDTILVKEPELMAKISKHGKYKSPIYNYF